MLVYTGQDPSSRWPTPPPYDALAAAIRSGGFGCLRVPAWAMLSAPGDRPVRRPNASGRVCLTGLARSHSSPPLAAGQPRRRQRRGAVGSSARRGRGPYRCRALQRQREVETPELQRAGARKERSRALARRTVAASFPRRATAQHNSRPGATPLTLTRRLAAAVGIVRARAPLAALAAAPRFPGGKTPAPMTAPAIRRDEHWPLPRCWVDEILGGNSREIALSARRPVPPAALG